MGMAFTRAVAGIVAFFSVAHATPALDQALSARFGQPTRTRNLECGIYLSPRKGQRHTDNSLGYRIADLNPEAMRSALARLRAEIGEVALDGDLAVSGLPLYDAENRGFLREVRQSLSELGLAPGQLRVIPMYAPTGRGVRGALGKLRATLLMRQDFEWPIAEEVRVGMPGVLAAEMTTLGYALASFPAAIAAPMATGHLGLLAVLSAFRRTVSNWIVRSRGAVEEFGKNGGMSALFVINYSVTSRWPELVDMARTDGAGEFVTRHVPLGVSDFVTHQGLTTLTQTVFFYLTFVRGVYRWEAISATDPERSLAARRTAAVLTPLIFSVTGPVLNWASTSSHVVASLGPIDLNPGQLTLAGFAAAGGILAWKPRLLDYTVPWVERLVYRPLAEVRAAWARFVDLNREER